MSLFGAVVAGAPIDLDDEEPEYVGICRTASAFADEQEETIGMGATLLVSLLGLAGCDALLLEFSFALPSSCSFCPDRLPCPTLLWALRSDLLTDNADAAEDNKDDAEEACLLFVAELGDTNGQAPHALSQCRAK
jgi:hypothetical protein